MKLRGTRRDGMVVSLAARAIRLPERMADVVIAEGDVATLGSRLGSKELSVASAKAKAEAVNGRSMVFEAQSHQKSHLPEAFAHKHSHLHSSLLPGLHCMSACELSSSSEVLAAGE